jgi:hypothetical protein
VIRAHESKDLAHLLLGCYERLADVPGHHRRRGLRAPSFRTSFDRALGLAARDCVERAVTIRVLLQIFPTSAAGHSSRPSSGPVWSIVGTENALRIFTARHCLEIQIANLLRQESISVAKQAFPEESCCTVWDGLSIGGCYE